MVEFLEWCDELGVEVVTLFLLSNDNLTGREASELTDLFQIIADLAQQLAGTEDGRIRHVGSSKNLPDLVCAAHEYAERSRSASTTYCLGNCTPVDNPTFLPQLPLE